jgi:hypothetical protein
MGSDRRAQLSQHDKYLGFKKAFHTIRAHREARCYLAAYVVAFSAFEDRLSAACMLAADLKGEGRPTRHVMHYAKIKRLESAGHVGPGMAMTWRQAGDKRNDRLHAAMWQVDAGTDGDVDEAVGLARAADALASRLKRELKAVGSR